MANFSVLLKSEITRLARKEVRQQVDPLRKVSALQRREIAELKRQVAALRRSTVARSRVASEPQPAPRALPIRFVAKGLRSLRARLGLSAAEFGLLAGASAQSIYNWESGKAIPRKSQLTVLAGLRSLGKRAAQARLLALADKSPRGRAAKN